MKKKKEIASRNANGFYRPGSRLVGFALATLLIAGPALCWSCKSTGDEPSTNTSASNAQASDKQGKKNKKNKNMAGSPINGGPFEASGVAFVPGTENVLFIDDSRPDEVLLMQVDQSGQQVGTARPLKTGASVENPEGITSDGTHFYVVGSQSVPKKGEQNAIVRFAFDPRTQTISGAEVIHNFRSLLLSKVSALQGDGDKKGADGGLNIEGIAWDPVNNRLLLGLRSPIRGGQALLVPLKVRNPNGPFTADNLDFTESRLIELPLGGSGVRDIQYDSTMKSFLLISGAPENEQKSEFILWQWDGAAQPKQLSQLDPNIKPEAITEMKLGGGSFIFMMGDANRYLRLDYSDFE